MRRRFAASLAAAAILVASGGCVVAGDAIPVLVDVADGTAPTFTWDGPPLNRLVVIACEDGDACDAFDFAPGPGAPQPPAATTWDVRAFDGTECGDGALRPPLVYGAPPAADVLAVVRTPPQPLAPGRHVVVVEQRDGCVTHVVHATGRAAFDVP